MSDRRRGRTLFSRTQGAKQTTHPAERLLGGVVALRRIIGVSRKRPRTEVYKLSLTNRSLFPEPTRAVH